MTTQLEKLGSELTLYAARLVRLLRRDLPQPVGMRVLSVLDESGPLGVTQLALVDQCSQPTMSGIVQGLVDRGWVGKQADPADRRSALVGLTPAGRQILTEARRANGAAIARRLSSAGVRADEVATAVTVLRAVLESEGSTHS
ncbi:MAG: MarR family winged helix-turn-helix transcriptional regulator [Actinomycetes bacterium]